MALALVWTRQAVQGFDNIIRYLELHWTEKEIRNFVQESEDFFELLSQHPELLQRTKKHRNVRRGPMNRLTILTYRIKPRKQQIEIINIRSARQKPLK